LRQRAFRPQLKRDPLGGALPPRDHPESTAVVWCVRGAPNAEPRGPLSVRRAPPPHGRAIGVPRRASSIRAVNAQKLVPQLEAGSPIAVRAARSSVRAGRAV